MTEMILQFEDVEKGFPISGGVFGREIARVKAVRGVSLSIACGETLGLVGESGCGKTTLSMLALRLLIPDRGKIIFDGTDITRLSEKELRSLRRGMQMVFQDPFSSLNPRMTIGDIVAEPLVVHRLARGRALSNRVMELLQLVGLPEEAFGRYPHEFSGGQRQRVGIARAIALNPKFIVADEPVSALDLSVRGEILNLLIDLRERFGLSYLFVSHDLKVVEQVSHRVCVMYLGKVMELFPAENQAHVCPPYTIALLASVPNPDPAQRRKKIALSGDVPSPIDPPGGCPFHPRCPYAKEICSRVEPKLEERTPGHLAACHFADEISRLPNLP